MIANVISAFLQLNAVGHTHAQSATDALRMTCKSDIDAALEDSHAISKCRHLDMLL